MPLTIREVLSDKCDADEWKKLNVEVEYAGVNKDSVVTVPAKFPHGWTVKLDDKDDRHAYYLDALGIPRAKGFLKGSRSDTTFFTEEYSQQLYNRWQENKKLIESLTQYRQQGSKSIVVYEFVDRYWRHVEYYMGKTEAQRYPRSEHDFHKLIGWFDDINSAQKIVDQLNKYLKENDKDSCEFIIRNVKEKPLDRFEAKHLIGFDSYHHRVVLQPDLFIL